MALVAVPGGLYYPPILPIGKGATQSFQAATAKTAAGHKLALMGQVVQPGGFTGTKNIKWVGLPLGALTAGSGNTVQDSIQGVATSGGAPTHPDGSILASGAGLSTVLTSGLTASTWNQFPDLGTVVPVSHGQLISIVLEFSAFGSGPSVVGNGHKISSAADIPMMAFYNGTTWSAVNSLPDLVIGFDDTTVGTLNECFPAKSYTGTGNLTSASNPNEYGNAITFPFDCEIDGIWINLAMVTTSSGCTLALRDSAGNVLGGHSFALDPNQVVTNSTGQQQMFRRLSSPYPINAGDTVYVSGLVTSSGSNFVAFTYMNVNATSHMDLLPGGTNISQATRNGGSFSATANQRLLCGVRISSLDDGAGAAATNLFYMEG